MIGYLDIIIGIVGIVGIGVGRQGRGKENRYLIMIIICHGVMKHAAQSHTRRASWASACLLRPRRGRKHF